MSTTTTQQPETDTTREQRVIAGKTADPKPAARKRAPSRATKSAAKNAPKPAAQPKPAREPVGAASLRAAEKNAPKPEMSESEARTITQSALIAAAGAMIQHWDEKKTGVSKADARRHATERLSYCGKNVTWDSRLDPRTR